MKNVRKILGIIISVLTIVFSIAACGEVDDPTTPPDIDTGDNPTTSPGTDTGGNPITSPGTDSSDGSDKPTVTMRYETIPYSGDLARSPVYSARDNTNNYYLFVLGHVNYVPLSYRNAVIYNGQRPVDIGYSSSTVSETSISRSVEEAYAHSVSNSSTSEWNKSGEVGVSIDGWFSAKVSETKGGSTGWEKTNTRSVANTFVTVNSWSSEERDNFNETIGNNNETPGKYRYSLFATTDVYYVLVTNRKRTQVTKAYTVVCARPGSLGWGIDYEPDMGGSFAKTAGGDLLSIPTIVLSQLPDPTDIYVEGSFPSSGENPPPPADEKIQEFDLRNTASSFSISTNTDRAIIIGDNTKTYRNLEILVAQRSSPLIIEFQNVRAFGKHGSNGEVGQNGESGRPVISMGSNMARVPDLTIVSNGNFNELQGGTGGNGGIGNNNSTGKNGGNGGAAIMAERITITGNANITLKGGDGGNGDRGGNLGTSLKGTSGGNGGNGGAAINANNITIDISGIVYALRSNGGNGGTRWQGSTGLASGGSNGASGTQGVPYTSTPRILDGVILERL